MRKPISFLLKFIKFLSTSHCKSVIQLLEENKVREEKKNTTKKVLVFIFKREQFWRGC